MQEMTRWENKDRRRGELDSYTVMGVKFENASSFETGWHITSWRSGFDPVHDYWVSHRQFYAVTIHYMYKSSPLNVIEIHQPPVTNQIDEAERKAVLKAIEEWTLPQPTEKDTT
jgi:hypothetical protein